MELPRDERNPLSVATYSGGTTEISREGFAIHPNSIYRENTEHYCYDSRHEPDGHGGYRSCLCKHIKVGKGFRCAVTGERLIRHEHPEPKGKPIDVWIPCPAKCSGAYADYVARREREASQPSATSES